MTKTAHISAAPGCIGSPTLRAMKHPLCETCVFRSACARIAAHYERELEEVIGARALVRPAASQPGQRKAPTSRPAINGKEISDSARQLLKDLQGVGYDRKGLNDLLLTKGRGETPGKAYPWLNEAIETLAEGCTLQDVRGVIKRHGIKGTMAASRAAQFVKVLAFYDLITFEEKTGRYVPNTGEVV